MNMLKIKRYFSVFYSIMNDRLSNSNYPEINHMQVFQQNKGGLCGFHSYYNSICLIKGILAQSNRERL